MHSNLFKLKNAHINRVRDQFKNYFIFHEME